MVTFAHEIVSQHVLQGHQTSGSTIGTELCYCNAIRLAVYLCECLSVSVSMLNVNSVDTFHSVWEPASIHGQGLASLCITGYSSTLYIGIAMVFVFSPYI